jgi:hypothetical protein
VADNNAHAHIVEVDELVLINHQDEEIDLRAVFVEIEMTSSVFEPGIRGSVLIYDALGLINRFPIVGEERLRISYKTPENRSKKGEFYVWRISDEYPDEKGNSSTYRLHLCGIDMLSNAREVVAKSYTNTDDVMAVVQDIMSVTGSPKEVRTRDQTIKDPAKVLVIPFYHPFEALDMLRRRAYTESGGSDYFLFFERWDAWFFTSIDSLVADPINNRETDTVEGEGSSPLPDTESWKENWWVYASDKFQMDSTRAKDIRRISTLKITQRFDSIQKIRQGAYDNEVVQYSIIDKAITTNPFNFESDSEPLIGGSRDRFDTQTPRGSEEKNPTNTPEFIAQYSVPDSGYYGSAPKTYFRLKDPEEKDGVVKKSGLRHRSTQALLDQVQVTVTVAGDTMVDVGDIVHLVVPRFDSLEDTQPDKFLYGKFVVGALRDSILSPDKHAMTVDLYKDGYWQAIGASEIGQE